MRILSLVIAVAVISGCASAPQRSERDIQFWSGSYARSDAELQGDYSGTAAPLSREETIRRLAKEDRDRASRKVAAAIIGGAISGTLRGIDNRHRYRPRRHPEPPRPPRPPR